MTVTMLARRAVFERVGTFNTALTVGDPMEWFARAMERGVQTELLPDPLVYRRMHRHNLSWESGASRQMTGAMKAAILRVVKGTLDRRRARAGPVPSLPKMEGADPSVPRTGLGRGTHGGVVGWIWTSMIAGSGNAAAPA